jgi:beta-lactamase regulating signal transducer with metallopeptidase domain
MNAEALRSIERFVAAWVGWMGHMTWQVALVAIVLGLLTFVLRRRRAVFLYALWLLVPLRLLLPPDLALPTGWGWWLRPAEAAEVASAAGGGTTRSRAVRDALREGDPPRRTAELDAGAAAKEVRHAVAADNSASSTSQGQSAAEVPPGHQGADAPRSPPTEAPATSAAAIPIPWPLVLCVAWAGIAGALLAVMAAGMLRVRRWVRLARPIDDPAVLALVDLGRARLGIRRVVALKDSGHCATPLVAGLWRPTILLPSGVLGQLDREELRSVLLHELGHVARHDLAVNLLQGVLGALYFIHPCVWWANAMIRRLREEACDELTLAALDGRRRPYGSAIVKVTELVGYAAPALTLGILDGSLPARRRLGRILDENSPPAARLGWGALAAVVLAGAVLIPCGCQPSLAPAAGGADEGNADGATADGAVADAEAANLLRYNWKPDRAYMYDVRIEALEDGGKEVLAGNPTYEVRSTSLGETTLVFNGRLFPRWEADSGFPRPPDFSMMSPFSPFTGVAAAGFGGEHVLTIDDRGAILNVQGASQLPFMLGNLSQLAIEPLPAASEGTWETTNNVTISITHDRFFSPFRNSETQLDATEKTVYTLGRREGDRVAIEKRYELRTAETAAGKPLYSIDGEGRVVFDAREGVPVEMRMKLSVASREGNQTTELPVTVTYKLLDEAETARRIEEAKQAAEAAAAQAAANPPDAGTALPPSGYNGPHFVPSTGRAVAADTALFVGQIVQVQDSGAWYAADVLELLDDGQVRIHFRGWSDTWDKAVPRGQIQLAPEDLPQPGRPPENAPPPAGEVAT